MKCLSLILLASAASAAETIDPLRYEKEVLVAACSDPMQLDVATDGRVFFVERGGAVKVWEPAASRTLTLGNFPALTTGDAGALGLALARDFSTSGHIYIYRIPLEPPALIVISRFTLQGDKLNAATE